MISESDHKQYGISHAAPFAIIDDPQLLQSDVGVEKVGEFLVSKLKFSRLLFVVVFSSMK